MRGLEHQHHRVHIDAGFNGVRVAPSVSLVERNCSPDTASRRPTNKPSTERPSSCRTAVVAAWLVTAVFDIRQWDRP